MGSQSDSTSDTMHAGALAKPILRLLICIVAVFVVTAALSIVPLRDRPVSTVLIFLFLVLIISRLWSVRYAAFVSFLAALGFSWLIPPSGHFFWRSTSGDILVLAVFLVVGITTSHVSDRARGAVLSAKRAEESARRSEQGLREVIETMPAMAWSALPDGSNAFANRQWAEYTGLSAEQTAGSGWQSIVYPEDLNGHMEKWRQSLATGQPFEHEARYRRTADGQYRWFLVRGMPLRDEHGEILKWYGIATDIEDRKQAEQALRKSEERWKSVFENSAIGVALADLNGRFLVTNHVFQTMVGYTEGELHLLSFLDVTHEHYREANVALITELVEGKRRQFQIEKKYRRKDSSLIWVSNNVSLVPGTEGAPRFLMALSEDITERKRAEALLTGEKRILEMVAKGDPLHQILDTVCQFVEEQASGSLASILLVDGNRVRHGGAPSLPKAYTDAIDGAVIGPSAGSCGTAAYRGEQVIVEDIATDPLWADYRELALPHSLRAAWSTPVFSSQGKVIATFAMYYREPRSPSLSDQETIEQITHLAGVAIEQKLTQEALARSEHNLSLIINTIPALVWSARPDGSADFFNQHYLDFVGLSAEQAQNWGWTVAVHPDDLNRLGASWQSIMASGKQGESEARLRRFGGEYRWFLFRANPLRDESGNIVKWFGINTDIEDRKRAEENLRRSERDLHEAQRISQTGSWKLDVSSGTVTVSPQVFRIFGVKSDEDTSTPEFWFSRNHPEDQKRIQELFKRSANLKTDYDADYRIVLPDGTIKHLHAVGHPVLNESGDLVQFVGTTMDVTERKQSEEALRRSESYLAEAQKMTHTGSWAWNVRTDALFWSHEIFRIYDYGPEMTPTWGSLLERVTPKIVQRSSGEKKWSPQTRGGQIPRQISESCLQTERQSTSTPSPIL